MHRYGQVLLTYIDILGFKEMVDKSDCEKIHEILSNFYYITKEEESFKKSLQFKIISFSDTSLRCYKMREVPIGLLLFELANIGMIQCLLLGRGNFMRGCIHAGLFYASRNVFYGPALIEAYNLESKDVNYPMIALSPKISQIMKEKAVFSIEHSILIKDDYEDIVNVLFKRNGLHYLDYLKVALRMVNKETIPGLILMHKELIKKKLIEYSSNPRVLPKYEWLAEYHNSFLESNHVPGTDQAFYI